MRTLIFGGPRTGKTTLALALAASNCPACAGTGLGQVETHGPFESGDKIEFVLVEKPCPCVARVRGETPAELRHDMDRLSILVGFTVEGDEDGWTLTFAGNESHTVTVQGSAR